MTNRPVRMMNAPGAVRLGSRMDTRKRPIRPPVKPHPISTSWSRPSSPAYASAMPSRVRPHGAPGSLPGPHSTYQPAIRSTTGNRNRPEPKNGAVRSRHQSVRLPPWRMNAIPEIAPSRSRPIPTSERTTAGDSPSERFGLGSPEPDLPDDRVRRARGRAVEPVERDVERRRWAIR